MTEKVNKSEAELSPEEYQKILKEQSVQIGSNLQSFLDRLQLSARTDEDRKILQVYSGVMEVAEKLAAGELLIVNANSLTLPSEKTGKS